MCVCMYRYGCASDVYMYIIIYILCIYIIYILCIFYLVLECIPPSLRFFSGSEQVDLARKIQEDPLYAIKKKEMETRNQLLKNPVKLKQLKELVSADIFTLLRFICAEYLFTLLFIIGSSSSNQVKIKVKRRKRNRSKRIAARMRINWIFY